MPALRSPPAFFHVAAGGMLYWGQSAGAIDLAGAARLQQTGLMRDDIRRFDTFRRSTRDFCLNV